VRVSGEGIKSPRRSAGEGMGGMHVLLGVVEVVKKKWCGGVVVGLQESGARGVVVFEGQLLGSASRWTKNSLGGGVMSARDLVGPCWPTPSCS